MVAENEDNIVMDEGEVVENGDKVKRSSNEIIGGRFH